MSRRIAALAVLLLVAVGLVILQQAARRPAEGGLGAVGPRDSAAKLAAQPEGKKDRVDLETSRSTIAISPSRVAPGTVPLTPGAAAIAPVTEASPAGPDPSGLSPQTVLENARSVFRQYASRFGGNPVGTNPEITAALNGGNPGQARFLKTEDGLRINAQGELIDSWGMPYFFHQLSATEMEIHSAGPDRRMWTDDDLVIK